MPAVTPLTDPAAADALEQRLNATMLAFNVAHLGPQQAQRLAFEARGGDGQPIGGLVAWRYWNYLHVDTLWVDAPQRGHGHGRALMQAAEEAARAQGLDALTLDTFAFAAPQFYAALGYRCVGALAGTPAGTTRTHWCKWIGAAGDAAPDNGAVGAGWREGRNEG